MATRIARLLEVFAALAIAPVASAAAPLAPLMAANDAPLTDGADWGVIPVSDGMLVLHSGDAGRISQRHVALGAPCAAQYGSPRGVGSGLVDIECAYATGQPAPHLLVYDLVAQTFTAVAGATRTAGTDGTLFGSAGRTWLAFEQQLHHGGRLPGLLNWRTGEMRLPTTVRDRVVDLDAASGSRKLCRTIRRPRSDPPPTDGPPDSDAPTFTYRAPFALVERGAYAFRRLVLQRCSGRSIALGKEHRGGQSSALGERAVAWVTGRTIHARSLRTGRAASWKAPLGKAVLGVAMIGRQLLVTIQGGPYGGPLGFGFTVYRAPLP
jgi:hypothetical protein